MHEGGPVVRGPAEEEHLGPVVLHVLGHPGQGGGGGKIKGEL